MTDATQPTDPRPASPVGGEALKRFADDVTDVQSRIIIVHQLRASADIQDAQVKRETGWATTTDRAELMRKAADAIENLAALSAPSVTGEAVAWTGSSSLARIKGRGAGFHGYIYGKPDAVHPIALYAAPVSAHPVEVTIFCPECSAPHIDEGEWATTRHHKTHQCQSCGHEWHPFPFATVGVAPPTALEERCARMEAALTMIRDCARDRFQVKRMKRYASEALEPAIGATS